MTINGHPYTGVLRRSAYRTDDINALFMNGPYGPIATITVNPVEQNPDMRNYLHTRGNYCAVKDYSGNKGVLESLVSQGIVRDTGIKIPAGFAELSIVEIMAPELRI